jgi:dienelactone hydrolase
MNKELVEFKSEGVTLRADFYKPAGGVGPHPTIVMGGGWCYVKELIQPEYAKYFVDAGYACLVFDYRNLGESDGTPRQHINPWEQIEDYRNAISYAETRKDVDCNRIGIWGISYSGAHVLAVGALDSRVQHAQIDEQRGVSRVHGTDRIRPAPTVPYRRAWPDSPLRPSARSSVHVSGTGDLARIQEVQGDDRAQS